MIDPARHRVLITGAAGAIGSALRAGLRNYGHLRLTDIRAVEGVAENEEFIAADVCDRAGLMGLMQGVDALVHMTGAPAEHDLETLFAINARGLYDVFEAARLAGVKRIVYASSNHAFGCYPIEAEVQPSDVARPDSLYGAFKVLGETMLQYYRDRHGIASVSLRIGTYRPLPIDQRSLATWLSPRDVVQLVDLSLRHPDPGALVVNAYSNNTRLKVGREGWDFLGYRPLDNAEDHIEMLRSQGVDVDGAWEWAEHGGAFARQPEKPVSL
jgi:uronate dehydrogenase